MQTVGHSSVSLPSGDDKPSDWYTWTTRDEKNFIQGLINSWKLQLAIKYCRLVLSRRRFWDDTVNVAEVERYAFEAIARIHKIIKREAEAA